MKFSQSITKGSAMLVALSGISLASLRTPVSAAESDQWIEGLYNTSKVLAPGVSVKESKADLSQGKIENVDPRLMAKRVLDHPNISKLNPDEIGVIKDIILPSCKNFLQYASVYTLLEKTQDGIPLIKFKSGTENSILENVNKIYKSESNYVVLGKVSIGKILHEVAYPNLTINQAETESCGPVSILIEICQHNPTLGMQIVTDLLVSGEFIRDNLKLRLPTKDRFNKNLAEYLIKNYDIVGPVFASALNNIEAEKTGGEKAEYNLKNDNVINKNDESQIGANPGFSISGVVDYLNQMLGDRYGKYGDNSSFDFELKRAEYFYPGSTQKIIDTLDEVGKNSPIFLVSFTGDLSTDNFSIGGGHIYGYLGIENKNLLLVDPNSWRLEGHIGPATFTAVSTSPHKVDTTLSLVAPELILKKIQSALPEISFFQRLKYNLMKNKMVQIPIGLLLAAAAYKLRKKFKKTSSNNLKHQLS